MARAKKRLRVPASRVSSLRPSLSSAAAAAAAEGAGARTTTRGQPIIVAEAIAQRREQIDSLRGLLSTFHLFDQVRVKGEG